MNIFTELANESEVIWYLRGSKYRAHSTMSLSSKTQLDDHWGKSDVSDSQRWRTDSYASQYYQCHSLWICSLLSSQWQGLPFSIQSLNWTIWNQNQNSYSLVSEKISSFNTRLFVFVKEADMTEKSSSYTLCMGVLN